MNSRGLDGYHPYMEDEAYGLTMSFEEETRLTGLREIEEYLNSLPLIDYLNPEDDLSDDGWN